MGNQIKYVRYVEEPGFVLNIRKPIGWTSFDVVRWVKKRIPEFKVGHAGTLDPFAEGVLLVCVGAATKKVSELMSKPKEYRTRISLGIQTDTLDITGNIIDRKNIPSLNVKDIEQVAQSYIGTIRQVPPRFSALKSHGKRFYKMAREGIDVEPEPREIFIQDIKILNFNGHDIELEVNCLKGTFIRSLGRDLAKSLNTVGFLKSLIRTCIGDYHLNQSQSLGESRRIIQLSSDQKS